MNDSKQQRIGISNSLPVRIIKEVWICRAALAAGKPNQEGGKGVARLSIMGLFVILGLGVLGLLVVGGIALLAMGKRK